MPEVIFDDEQIVSRHRPVNSKPSTIEKIVYKTGLAKTRRSAQYVLVVVIILCILLSVASLYVGGLLRLTPTPSAQTS